MEQFIRTILNGPLFCFIRPKWMNEMNECQCLCEREFIDLVGKEKNEKLYAYELY